MIRDNDPVAINAQKQQERIDEKHSKEAEARPDPVHRALVFLLDQIVLNNRDAGREARYHLRQLDESLGVPEKLEEITQLAEPDPTETAKEALAPATPAKVKARTADPNPTQSLRTSSRFKRPA